MLQWLRCLPLLVILILLLGPFALRLFNATARTIVHHSSSCARNAESSLCNADPSIPDELEDEKGPQPLPVMMPFTGHQMLEGEVPRLRSRVWYDSPLVNPLLPIGVD